MRFQELIDRLKDVAFQEIRVQDKDYFEAVLAKKELPRLGMSLSVVFGSPVWPASGRLPKEAKDLVSGFGGLRENQTLYYSRKDGARLFSMLWPWNDGERVTLKIGQK